MTLIAAFRCRNNGILLCADRAEEDSYARRPIDKIWRIAGLIECEVFIAGSGTTTTVKDARTEIENSLRKAAAEGRSILSEHRALIEDALQITHSRHKEDLKHWPLGLLIIISARIPRAIPALFRTDRNRLVSENIYAACGSGKVIADYLADGLYVHGIPNDLLVTLAAFIFREAEKSSVGVGLGNDMFFIYPGGGPLKELHSDSINEIEAGIPPMKDAIWSYWRNQLRSPEWLKDYADSAESKE